MTSSRDELKDVFSILPASRGALVTGFGKRLIKAAIAAMLVTALAPPIWLAGLVARGTWRGDDFEVFYDRLMWEDEFVARWPLVLIIAGSAAVGVFLESPRLPLVRFTVWRMAVGVAVVAAALGVEA